MIINEKLIINERECTLPSGPAWLSTWTSVIGPGLVAFEPPKRRPGSPNVLHIVLNDVGFSAFELGSRGDGEHRPDVEG